jgi:hypothetical protein
MGCWNEKPALRGQRGQQKTRHGYPAGLWHIFGRWPFVADYRFTVNSRLEKMAG